jgi:chromosome segregation ATPase
VLLQLAQLQAREQAFDRERQMQVQLLQNKEQLLDAQLANLTLLRARWNARRQEELAAFQAQCASLDQQQKECTDLRVALFGREQACGEAQRYLAEKSLALEQYSQEVACRTKDPDARERLEGLRRRWLALNAALIRDAKKERHDAQSDLARLETFQVELARTKSRLDHLSSEMALREAELDERAASTQARQAQLEIETAQLELARQTAQEKVHVLQAEVETLAKAVYDQPALDKAA